MSNKHTEYAFISAHQTRGNDIGTSPMFIGTSPMFNRLIFVYASIILCSAVFTATALAEKASETQIIVSRRTFPSVFQAWNPADNLPDEDELTTLARHDLVFHAPGFFGLEWNEKPMGLATTFSSASIEKALALRQSLLKKNPNLLLIAEIRYRDAHRSYLPDNHRWWKRNENGDVVMGWEEGGYVQLDFANQEFQKQVAFQAQTAMQCGVLDGIMLDWWEDDASRLQLVQQIRQAIGDKALILVNANDRTTPMTAPFINGYFMECYRSQAPEDWQRISDTLRWAEKNLRNPRINCLETWFHNSRDDFSLMRATTTLALTQSDGYCLFSDPNPLPKPDHLHNWYSFWDKGLGYPQRAGRQRPDGSWLRDYENGTVIYNPVGNNPTSIRFKEAHCSRATDKVAKEHTVAAGDGDILLKVNRRDRL